jgi:hypothetical protein
MYILVALVRSHTHTHTHTNGACDGVVHAKHAWFEPRAAQTQLTCLRADVDAGLDHVVAALDYVNAALDCN